MATPQIITVRYDVNREEVQAVANDWHKVAGNVGITEKKAQKLAGEFKKEAGIINDLKHKEQELLAARNKSNDVNQIRKLNAELGKTQSQLSDLTNTTAKVSGGGPGGGVGGLAGMLGPLAAFAPAAAIAGIAELGRTAISSAIEFEQLSISFETFLGSADKAAEVIAELESFSAATPFTSEEVLNAGRSLLAFGESADTVTDKLRMIGDISAGTGKDFGELATLFGKARVSGVIMAEDINQFTEAGIPIIDEFAKILGVSTSEVKKLGSQGQITFDTLQQAFTNMTSEGGKFNGLTQKLSQSTGGLLSTLQSNLQILLRDIGTALLPVVQVLIGYITDLFAVLGDAFGPAIDGFKSLGNALGFTGSQGGIVSTIVKVLGVKLRVLLFPLTLAGKLIGFLATKIADFIKESPKLQAVIEGIKDAFNAVGDAIDAVIGWFDDLLSVASDRVNTVTLLTQRLTAAGLTTQQAMKQMSATLKKEFGATDADLKAFSASFDTELLRNAGTMEEATAIIRSEYEKWAAATKPVTSAHAALKKEIDPLPGSIAFMQKELKKLNDEFSRATTIQERMALAEKIRELQTEIRKAQDPIDFMIKGLEKVEPALEKIKKSLREDLSGPFTEVSEAGIDFSFRMQGLQEDFAIASEEANNLREQLEAAFASEKLQAFQSAAQTVFGQVQQLGNSIQQLFDAQAAAQIASIEQRKQKELEAANTTGANREAIERRYNEQVKKIQKEVAIRQKRAAIFNAIIGTASAVISALDDAPVPFNFVLAALNAAAGAIQIAAIRAQPLPFAKGGLVTGGQPNKDSVNAVLMPGEFVMRKDTVKKYRPLIEALHNDRLGDILINGHFSDRGIIRAITSGNKKNRAITERLDRSNQLLAAMIDSQANFRRYSARRGY